MRPPQHDVRMVGRELDELREKWDQAAGESPLIPPWADRKAARELAQEGQDSW